MADDDYPLSFLPPMKFDPFMGRSLIRKGGAGGSPSLTWRTGYPYDLMEDIPPLGAKNSTSARGGAVKYIDPSYPGVFPQIDRYFAFVAKEEEISLWGYVKQAAEWNWQVRIPYDGKSVTQALYNTASETYLAAVIKDQNKESSVWGYNENAKRNYRIIADQDEAKVEAWENDGAESKYIIATTKDFPTTTPSHSKNKRLVLASESFKNTKPQLVKLRELELDLPKGCPFDLTFAVNENTDSSVGAVKHTGCTIVDGENVGNGVFERYAAAVAETTNAGFTAYYGVSNEGYLDASTKGQAETYVWGYADQGETNFRSQAFGYDAKTEIWHTNGNEYASLSYTTADSGAYGFHGSDKKYWRIYATNTRPEMQLWTGDGRAWASTFAQPAESAFYGWCDTQQSSARMRCIPFKGQVELWRSDGMNYALMEQKPGEASFYCFSNNQAFNFKAATTPGNTDKAEMSVWANGDSGYAVVGTKGQAETYLWGYADQGDSNVRLRAFGADASLEAWNNQQERGIYIDTKDFPSSSSGTKKKRLVAASEQYSNGAKPEIVKLRELELGIPHGCPYDLTFDIADNANSATGSVKHTGCINQDGELVGNNIYDRYAAARSDSAKTGFVTYFGTSNDGYLDMSTKGQAETYVWGYADQGETNFRSQAFGYEARTELWHNNGDEYAILGYTTTQSRVYGFHGSSKKYWLVGADGTKTEATVWTDGNDGYASLGTKGQAESYAWIYADQGDCNARLRAFGADASLEAWNNQQDRAIYLNTKEFPNTSSGTKKKRLVAASESYSNGAKPTMVKLRELELSIPHGCPFDIIFNVADSSNSASGAVKHTGCVNQDGELVGNDVYERYAAARAESAQTGFVAYWEPSSRVYLDNSVKTDETYTYGYADNGTSSHRLRSKAFRSELELWRDDGEGYALLRQESFATSLWCNAGGEVYNVKMAADTGADSSYFRAYGSGSNVFTSMHTEPDKASTWGYSNNQQNLYTNEASATAVFWRGSMSSATYNTLDVKAAEAGAWGYCASATNQYTAGAKATEVFYRTQLSSTYNSMDAKSAEAGNWGYISNGSNQYTLGAKSSEVFVRAQLSSTYNSMDAKSSEAGNWGYISGGSNAFTAGAKSSEVFFRAQLSSVYSTIDAKSIGAGCWGYTNNGTIQYTLGAQSSEAFLRGQYSQSYVGISVKNASGDIWGYTSGTTQWKAIATSSNAKMQVFNSSGWAEIFASGSQVNFAASLNNDYAYLTQNTLSIEYANGDSATVNPGEAWLNYSSGAWLQLYGGGVYMNDGSNYVDIQPPSGKDAYFRQVTLCVNGESKTAYFLMTEPE